VAANVVTKVASTGKLTCDATAADAVTFSRGWAFYEVVNLDATNGVWVRFGTVIAAAGEDGTYWVGPGQTKAFRDGGASPRLVSVFRDAGTPAYVLQGFYER
jgi:hypothetical protein